MSDDTIMLDSEEMDEASTSPEIEDGNDFNNDDAASNDISNCLLPGERHFHVRKWNAAAMWTWEFVVDNCAICRNHIMDKCIECQSIMEQSDIDQQCTIAWGKCSHVFHLHCISRWLNTRQVCPLDNSHWEFKKYGN